MDTFAIRHQISSQRDVLSFSENLDTFQVQTRYILWYEIIKRQRKYFKQYIHAKIS